MLSISYLSVKIPFFTPIFFISNNSFLVRLVAQEDSKNKSMMIFFHICCSIVASNKYHLNMKNNPH